MRLLLIAVLYKPHLIILTIYDLSYKIMKTKYLILSLFLLLFLYSCHKNKSLLILQQPVKAGDLTTLVLNEADFKSLVPLGSLNPSSHVYPTDHMYLYLTDPKIEAPLYAPGNLTIISLARNKHAIGTQFENEDYSIKLGAYESYIEFGHVSRLTDVMLAGVDFSKGQCQEYSLGGTEMEEKCTIETNIKVKAGDIIGYCGKVLGQSALDFGLYINNKPVCPLDYFSEPTRTELVNRISNYDGTIKPTITPVCGSANQNLDNTAQGVWLRVDKQAYPNAEHAPKYPESANIALVHDNIDGRAVFSIGLTVPGVSPNTYYFKPKATGLLNRDFADVKVDGNIYCYDYEYKNGGGFPVSFILQLIDAKTLKLENRNFTSANSPMPYAFTNNVILFKKE